MVTPARSLAGKERIENEQLRYCLERAIGASFVSAGGFVAFGFTSYKTLLIFDNSITLSENVISRLLYVGAPLLILAAFLCWKRLDVGLRLHIWSVAFSAICCVSACIHVWPIALKHPDILVHFNSANNLIFVVAFLYLGLPFWHSAVFFLSYSLCLFGPLIWLASSSDIVFHTICNDIICYSVACVGLARFVRGSNVKPIIAKYKNLDISSMFMDEAVHEAMESGQDLAELSGRKDTLILHTDIRQYTEFLKINDSNDELLLDFHRAVQSLIRSVVRKYHGKIQKTFGDGYLCLFTQRNALEAEKDLYDIEAATEAYLKNQVKLVLRAFMEIEAGFTDILNKHKLTGMQICGAVHYGSVLYDFFGTEGQQEFDAVSKNIAFASRLEQHTKFLQKKLGDFQFLVFSEEAFRLMDHNHSFKVHELNLSGVDADQIRTFPEVRKLYFVMLPSRSSFEELRKKAG